MNRVSFNLLPYQVDLEPEDLNYSDDILRGIYYIYDDLVKGKHNEQFRKKIVKYIKHYPNVPEFKDYLISYYRLSNNLRKVISTIDATLKQHPDYFFAKLYKAQELMREEAFEEIIDLFNGFLRLEDIFPDKACFHVEEVLLFHLIMVQFHAVQFKLEEANDYLDIMLEVDEENIHTKDAMVSISMHSLLYDKKNELESAKYPSIEGNYAVNKQTTELPTFENDIIWDLYETGIENHEDLLAEIMSLERSSLIRDLENVLLDCINRFEYFYERFIDEEDIDTYFYMPYHALFLLADIKSETTQPIILDLLRQGEVFLEFWFDDFLVVGFDEILLQQFSRNPEILFEFLKEENIYTYGKASVWGYFIQQVLHHPDTDDTYYNYIKDLLTYFLEQEGNMELIDSELNGLIIHGCVQIKHTAALPLIKKLINKDMVALINTFSYEEVEEEMSSTNNFQEPLIIFNNYIERYNILTISDIFDIKQEEYLL